MMSYLTERKMRIIQSKILYMSLKKKNFSYECDCIFKYFQCKINLTNEYSNYFLANYMKCIFVGM